MNNATNLETAIKQNAAAGLPGFTLDATGNHAELNSGYGVGIRGFDTPAKLSRFVARKPRLFAGYWVDGETGVEYFDAVSVIRERDRALQLAKRRGELAIWDFARGAEIRVDRKSGN